MDVKAPDIDCGMLRARIVELEATLSAAKQPIPVTPNNLNTYDSTRTNSVIKLVEALNRAANEVETPKPWPKTVPSSTCKDTPSAHVATLAAIDQTISRFNTKKVLTSAASTMQLQSRMIDKRRVMDTENSVTHKVDKVPELLAKLDAKEKQIIFLTTENLQLKSKISKLKLQLKSVDGKADISPIDKENKPNLPTGSESAGELNSKVARDLTARIDDLRAEAEEKLTAAALQVEELQRQLDIKTQECEKKSSTLTQLEAQLSEALTRSASVNGPVSNRNEDSTDTRSMVPKEEHDLLKRKLSEVTKAYNDSCQAQSTMKATMGQAVDKLRQFISELEDKNKQLTQARKENDSLKSRLSVLERGTFLPLSAVLNAELSVNGDSQGSSLDQGVSSTDGINSSCILANSYEHTTLAALNAMSDEHFLLHATQEEHHRIAYLRQAFLRMFHGKSNLNASEMMNLGRVICSLLSVDAAAQAEIVESIGKMASAANVSTGILNVFNIFD